MKRTPLLLIGFVAYSGKDIVEKANLIIECMTGNSLYSDSGPYLTAAEEALANYLAICGIKGRILNYAELKKAARKALNDALKALGVYIEEKYPANVANWQTTGYSVQTFDGVTHEPHTPANLLIKEGAHSGSNIVEFDKSLFAEYYEGRNWRDGEAAPKGVTASSKTRKMKFDEMTAGDKWNFQIRACGTKGTSDWSQTVSVIVR
jgi:hypothetical protein